MGRLAGIALVGAGLLAAAPATARAGEDDADMKKRIEDLESQLLELRQELGNRNAATGESLSAEIDRYLNAQEKGELWRDRNGNPLSKSVDGLVLSASARLRTEYWDNYIDASNTFDDSGVQTFTRYRLGIGADLHNGIGIFLEMNMAGAWGNAATTPYSAPVGATDAGFTITPSLYQGYVTGVLSETLGMDTMIGRFEASYGDEYVLGDNDFYGAGLSWDGVVLSKDWADKGFSLDVIYTKVVDGFKSGANGVDDPVYMFALMGNWYGSSDSTGSPGAMEPYYILIRDNSDVPGSPALGGVNTKDIHTTGVRWYGDKSTDDKGGMSWNVNANHQYSFDHNFSVDAVVRYEMRDTKWQPTIWGQGAYASGDQNNPLESYNPLFMDVHGRFGYSDFWTFSNLAVWGAGVEIHPQADLTYGISARSIHFARAVAPATSNELAWQTELYVLHDMNENVSVEAAYSFIKWRGGSATTGLDDVQRAYVNLVVAF
jgi:hypothetical protein